MAGAATPSTARRRLRLQVTGAVQGVGFRPFLYRAATEGGLAGWIRNDTRGVMLEMEGAEPALRRFRDRVRSEPPPRAVVHDVTEEWLPAVGLEGLSILASDGMGERVAAVLPDLATCDACLEDIGLQPDPEPVPADLESDPHPEADRRSGYAFTNCTDCGPRFSIIRSLPYDRPRTTMAGFELCDACRAEYEDPLDRRFHAQPTACPECGPRLWLEADDDVAEIDPGTDPIDWAAEAIRAGSVLAVKGLGGFHLVVDAADPAAVARLRARKHRPTKPLAVMVRDLDQARQLCVVPAEAEALLVQPEAPIVLLERRPEAPVSGDVAPGNPYLGVMLPYTPLHHLLMRRVDRPVVATSGNLTDEPICIGNGEARARLGGIADAFVLHDRPIQRAVDDSVVQIVAGAPRLLRRSRGYAPLPVRLDRAVAPILAVGGHLKNTIALSRGRDVFLSQHIGDLETPQALEAFERVIHDFLRLYEVRPTVIAHDLHPDYSSTLWAETVTGLENATGEIRRVPVQHHHAHLAACLADTGEDRALGVVWDGTGLGPDGTVWGGEFLLGGAGGYERVAHLRPFRLPGGDAAVKEPRRMALALAHAAWGEAGIERALGRLGAGVFDAGEVRVLRQVLESGFRAPWTTSAGRLFDGVASLLGLHQRAGFEGEAAMALEYAVAPGETGAYPFDVRALDAGRQAGREGGRDGHADAEGGTGGLIVDWAPAVDALLDDVGGGADVATAAARFHNGLVAAIRAVAEAVGEPRVALTGGVFQNRVLTEGVVEAVRAAGLRPLLHRQVPANDGGLSLGQVAVAAVQHGEAN
ncbi:MAG: carbamoyltransferase HypF [Longimicrobiales bacterium]